MDNAAASRAIAALLKSKRLAAGLTQEQLASEMGVPQSFIAKLGSAERRLTLVDGFRISRILDFPASDFDAAIP